MKKVLVVLLCLGLILVGCRNTETESKVETAQNIDKETFIANFEALLEPAGFSLLQHVELDEVSSYSILDELTDNSTHLSVNYTDTGEITTIIMNEYISAASKLNFAVFSLYIYEALELPEVEAQDFYDKYDLFSEDGASARDEISGWELTLLDIEYEGEVLRTFSIGK